jgi:hypothetical protein
MVYRIVPRLTRLASYVCLGLLLFAVVFQPGCRRSTTVGPKGEKVTVTKGAEGAEVAFKGINGEDVRSSTSKRGVALPADFPTDIAIYPKATPMTVAIVGKETTVILTTPDSREKVVAFYKDKMKQNGWKSQSSTDMPQISMFQSAKAGRTWTVLISASPEGSVQITLSHKQ